MENDRNLLAFKRLNRLNRLNLFKLENDSKKPHIKQINQIKHTFSLNKSISSDFWIWKDGQPVSIDDNSLDDSEFSSKPNVLLRDRGECKPEQEAPAPIPCKQVTLQQFEECVQHASRR